MDIQGMERVIMTADTDKIVIGVDVGGTTTTAGLIDSGLNVLESSERQTDTSSQQALLSSLQDTVRDLAAALDGPVAAVGFGIPSMIDQSRGRTVMSVNVPLADLDFVQYMRRRLDMPVFIDNDANVAALAEARAGAARGARHMVMVTLGTGIGGGIIIDGRVYRGATGSAAELGHMVIDANGPQCPGACPNYGCFEAMASGPALTRYAREAATANPGSPLGQAAAAGEKLDGALVQRLADGGDRVSGDVFDRLGFYLGVGMTSLVNIFNPEYFIVGGGVMRAGGLVLEPALEVLRTRGLKPNRDIVQVKAARFGPEAGMLGAACLALESME
ncbi:MAG TPA: ROK family protein [Actinobacteria bacterium]|nr:ROK family protein [Actinomycetota bacterium]